MSNHLKVDAADTENRLDHMAQGVLGQPLDRLEGPLKVTGKAIYSAEARRPGLLHGVLVQAAIPRGKVMGMDDAPGAFAVITDPRFLRQAAQGLDSKGPPSGPDDVEYMGQAVALVVAETLEAAQSAARNLRIRYEPRKAEFDPEAVEPELPPKKQSSTGDLDAAMASAAAALDEVWHTPSMSAAAMEPHAAIAEWQDGSVTIRASMQMLSSNRKQMADALGVAEEKVRLLAAYVGGGFGSKLGINAEAVAAAIAAEKLGRPVSVTMTRQQVFDLSHRRSETRQRVLLACDATGRLTGIGHEALVSNLPGSKFSEPVTQATPFTYAAENRRIVHAVARVHRSSAGSVRAPGEAVGVTIFECAMDKLAERAGLDPVELRLKNIPDTEPVTDRPFSSHKLAEALRVGADRFGWSERRAPGERQEGEWLIGIGMAAAVRVNMLIESRARVTLQPSGDAVVETDMTDIGTGTYTILGQLAAEMLGLPRDGVRVLLGDTDSPPASGSGGSFGAASSGTSVYLACQDIRRHIADRMGCDERNLTLQNGRARAENVDLALGEVMDGPLVGEGHLEPGATEKTVRQATWGSHWAEVAVNRWTGETRVRRMLGVFACGRLLNPKTARSQCLGGMTFGIGMALTEELAHDPRDGHVVSRDLAEYHIPCHADVPALEVEFLEERDAFVGPLQAKGIGELGICGAGAAVLNAIYNACGVRVRELPATPDKIIAGLMV
ncbi:xanthine dehydrogenase family protein molybdopterin-binding subunit [Haematobacter massiliensis]|uniref:xanthine dehydrogenase family protein molybdopterin-binding subunit n=1 Tax=Haematobacter massiliensis TaxID=195105 RepID=UPI001039575E|nr:xanthine dehydrogenase family protein molybdopterin-binding subunit [Haematobacter massiliensis]QBJ25525.1 xanthine dehydrogenase family protein molybdopterin-binding subunit [Haematobacter massiliensis]